MKIKSAMVFQASSITRLLRHGAPAVSLVGMLLGGVLAAAQQTGGALPHEDPKLWADAAVRNELAVINGQETFPVRFRERKIDSKGDTTREIIQSSQGMVARLMQRNGQPITAEEDAAEQKRLKNDIAAPDDFLRHHKRELATRDSSMQLVGLMPQAMIFSYTPGQPQPKGESSPQIVLDFRPNPSFKTSTMASDILTGIEGRVWIDARSQCMTRIEGRILKPINFGFGLLAKLYPGGTIEFEQAPVGSDRWVYRHVQERLEVRALMVKTIPVNTEMTSWDFRVMPSLVSYQDAIRILLAMPLR